MAKSILAGIKQKAEENPKKTMVTSLRGKIILIYSTNNQGKTYQAIRLDENCLVLATEKGYNASALKYDPVDIPNFKILKDVTRELSDERNLKDNLHLFHLIIIDSIDKINDLATMYVCKREGVSKIGDIPYGGGYAMVRQEINDICNKLTLSGYGVVFIDHDETDPEYIDPVTGKKYPYTFPKGTMSKSGSIFRDLADFTIYLENKGTDEDGKVILSDGIMSHRKNVFARSRYMNCPTSISPFTAENLKKAVREAVVAEAKAQGAEVVDDIDESSFVKSEEEIEKSKEEYKDELVSDINAFGKVLITDFADECAKIMSELPCKPSKAKIEHIGKLENILENLKDLADKNNIVVDVE